MNAEFDVTGVVIKTERLTLRPWKESDLDDFFEYASVDGVGQMAGWLPHESKEKSKQILDMFVSEKKTFALEKDGKVVGSLGVEKYNETEFPELSDLSGREIGCVLAKDFWGNGLMPEAVKAVCDYCFETLGYDFLMYGNFERNNRSRRVREKCGFKYVKTVDYTTRMNTAERAEMGILFNPKKNEK